MRRLRGLPQTWAQCADRIGKRDSLVIANNTRLVRREWAAFAIRLHRTDVVMFHQDGRIVLHTGGWYTFTTKDRINRALYGWRVWSERGEWYIYSSVTEQRFAFDEGIVLFPNGRVSTPLAPTREDELSTHPINCLCLTHTRRRRRQQRERMQEAQMLFNLTPVEAMEEEIIPIPTGRRIVL